MEKKHLYEIDLMRTMIMFGVLSVHTMTVFKNQLSDGSAIYMIMGSLHSSMHVTRMAFMFITGFVLFVTYYFRKLDPVVFWKKRLTLIAIPYVFWNFIYIIFRGLTSDHDLVSSLPSFLKQVGTSIMYGDEYYIYYVLISCQLYVIFPAMLYGLRKWEKYHKQIFIGSFILQIMMMAFYKYGIVHLDTSNWPYLLSHYGVFVLTYQCWFVAGGVAACHYEKIASFIDKHYQLLLKLLAGSVVIMWGYYFFNRYVLHLTDHKAQSVHQPLFLPYSLIIIMIMLFLGRQWSRRRTKPNWQLFSRFVMLASSTSFGMFLVQPFPLYVLKKIVPLYKDITWLFYVSIPFSILFVYFSSMLIAYLINKTPLLSYSVGRKSKLSKRSKVVNVPSNG